jgi:hypothetical protein
MMKLRTATHLVLACLTALICGCNSAPPVHRLAENITEAEAIEIAETEVQRRSTSGFHSKMTLVKAERAIFERDRWLVDVWHLPERPGGYLIVEIGATGKVLAIRSGM